MEALQGLQRALEILLQTIPGGGTTIALGLVFIAVFLAVIGAAS